MAEIRIQTRNSIQSPSQVTNSHKPYQTINREQLDEIVAFVKKRRTRTVLEHEKLDILLLQAKLRYKLHEKQKKVGRRQKRKAAITDHVAHLLQRKKELVGNVWRDYWMSQEVGRQYTSDTTFPQVRERLVSAFENLKPSSVAGCIDKANRNLVALHRELFALDALENTHDDSNYSESSSESSTQSDAEC